MGRHHRHTHLAPQRIIRTCDFGGESYWAYPKILPSLRVYAECTTLASIGFLHWSGAAWRASLPYTCGNFAVPPLVSSGDLPSDRPIKPKSFLVPRSRTTIKQRRSFSAAGPSTWNGLPVALRLVPRGHTTTFFVNLKTVLFSRGWTGSASE